MSRPISLAALTVLELSPPDMVSCAATAGYSHVGIRLLPATAREPHYDMAGDSAMLREVLARLSATGTRVLDIEILRLTPETRVIDYLPVLETGARLGAHYVLVAGNDPVESRLTARFAALCELCRCFGLSPHLEAMPWTDVKTVAQAGRIVKKAGVANGGVLVDPIHWHRSDGTLAEIEAIPASRFGYAQFCDAPLVKPDTLAEILFQGRAERLFPGEGGIDLTGLLGVLPPDLPLALEIPRQAMAKTVNAGERARLALQATRALLRAAGEATANDQP